MHARSGAMPEPQRDDHSVLTTAAIFDDAIYLSEALSLAANQSEDDYDADLALLASESGVEDPYRFLSSPHDISRALSTVTLDSDHRSSMSVHSQETQSTSFTSAPSRTSRDQIHTSERSPAPRTPPKVAQALATVEHHDQTIDAPLSNVKERHSSSTLSVSRSALSDSSSSSNPVPRRKRGSGLFGLFRKDSSPCTSQSHHGYHGKARGPKLECGHSLSPHAIRVHIQEALQGGEQAAPSCCGKPLPRKVLEVVLPQEEAERLINRTLQSSGIDTGRDSGYCEKGVSVVDLARPLDGISQPATSTSLPLISCRRRYEVISIDSALANEAFTTFRFQEKEQFERVSAFECNQRKALSAHHTCSLKRLAFQHEASRSEKLQQHTHDLEHLEEVQIIAEHDLRKAHELETQNVATALKHMEAYCLGSGQSHLEHTHVVTEEDFNKLDRQRLIQQNLPRKHENSINVLRARQERQMQTKLQKQEAELGLLDATHERERATEELVHTKEVEKLEVLIETRRKRLLQRWDLKFEMWRRDWEDQHGTTVTLRLEHESWPLQTTKTMTPIPESSSLAPYVQAVA